ncbi:BcsR/BcsP family cellulose biosynthesis protein [Paracidovorax citrulli]
MSTLPDHRRNPRANNDIGALGEKVPGFDPHRYYDQQEVQAAQAADRRWPRLARWLGQGGKGGHGNDDRARDAGQAG